jgi:hypothetical protein
MSERRRSLPPEEKSERKASPTLPPYRPKKRAAKANTTGSA